MLKDIIEVRLLDDYRLFLRFEDGVEGNMDLTKLVGFNGIFGWLQKQENFLQVRVDSELLFGRTAPISTSDVLYGNITGVPNDVRPQRTGKH